MSAGRLSGLAVAVAGAGAFGGAIALALARDGARVTLIDPAPPADNASGVAAGMLAPAFEALLDAPMAGRFALLKAARDLWPAFIDGEADGASLLRRSGAAWVDQPGAAPMAEIHAAALAGMGARVEPYPRSAGALRGLFTPEDWLVDPVAALAAFQRGLAAGGGQRLTDRAIGFRRGRVRLASGEDLPADRLVAATGASASGLAPELALLTPIKGQLLYFAGAAAGRGGPTLRCAGGYAAPGAEGLKVGATMEPGIADSRPTPEAAAKLGDLASALFPELAWADSQPLAGVRAASPDGLPLVGPSATPGVVLAVGARRNGWLLAPLVARMTADYLAGDDPGPDARAFDPSRFGPG